MWWRGGKERQWGSEDLRREGSLVGMRVGWRRKGRRGPQGRAEALQLAVNVQELRRFCCCVGGLCNES
jgi:hypothetical protein